jgi:hypothetical protein
VEQGSVLVALSLPRSEATHAIADDAEQAFSLLEQTPGSEIRESKAKALI